jgi:hypothetical protein
VIDTICEMQPQANGAKTRLNAKDNSQRTLALSFVTVGKLGVNKLGYQSVGNVLVITTVTTTTTSEPAGESSNTAEDVNDEVRRRSDAVNSAGSATKFSKKVLEAQIVFVILRRC